MKYMLLVYGSENTLSQEEQAECVADSHGVQGKTLSVSKRCVTLSMFQARVLEEISFAANEAEGRIVR